jgi:hypothetical protein
MYIPQSRQTFLFLHAIIHQTFYLPLWFTFSITSIHDANFNNQYGGKAVINAMQFKEMIGMSLSTEERRVLERAQTLTKFVSRNIRSKL